jgi:carbon-monoxide dehydrogenase large subunit
VPFAARRYGRPVKWTEDRREHLMAANHARDVEFSVEIACDLDGTVLGFRGHAYNDIGAYIRTNGSVGPRNVVQFLAGPYRVPHIDLRSTMLVSNKTPTGTYRGPGRFEADFIRERLFDMVAKDLGIDRVAFRQRNLVSEAEMPYPIATIRPYESKSDYDSGNYQLTFQTCLEKFGWAAKSKLEGQLVDGRYHGLGTGCFIEGGAAGPKEDARILMEADGHITVYVGSTSVGQGIETILAQIAADALEVPIDTITIRHGSTHYVPDGYGSYHSRSTVMGGSAILNAVANLKSILATEAGRLLDCPPEAISLIDGRAVGPNGRSCSWADVAKAQVDGQGVAAEGTFANHKYTYAYGAHAAHVAVDPATGHVEILDYVCTEDVGRIINPETLHGQVIGAVVQGLGGVFLEHLIYDDQGQLLTGSFADYLLPTASDYPNIRAYSTGDYPSPFNPLGAKGAGEGGIISVGGVIANAVANALQSIGVEPRDLPLSPPRVWQMIEDARAP